MTIRIEPQSAAHAEGLYLALLDERIYEFLDDAAPRSIAAVRAVIERRLKGAPASSGETWLNWTVFEGEVVVGFTQATVLEDGTASLGYVLSPIAWGRSVAYAACVLTMAELEASWSVAQFVADTDLQNVRSQALLERLGFRREREDQRDVYYERAVKQA